MFKKLEAYVRRLDFGSRRLQTVVRTMKAEIRRSEVGWEDYKLWLEVRSFYRRLEAWVRR